MKTGILTYHYIPNIGATLQAYATYKIMSEIGLDVEIIDYRCDNINKREIDYHKHSNPIKNFILKNYVYKRRIKMSNGCQRFIFENTKISRDRYLKSNIKNSNDIYDIFVSGSDMIWNLDVNGYDYTYFLDFTDKNKKRFSYASSIGDKWEKTDVDKIKKLLNRYDYLSMREKDSSDFLNTIGLKCNYVVDPTMLINKKVWNKLARKPEHYNYVLVYFPYDEILSAAKLYAEKNNKKLLVVNNGLRIKGVNSVRVYNPKEWMGLIKYADAIFTDSYHGVLFSLYFEKEFYTNNKSNRVKSVIDYLDINHVFIENNKKVLLDYNIVNKKIKQFKEESIKYLNEVVENING